MTTPSSASKPHQNKVLSMAGGLSQSSSKKAVISADMVSLPGLISNPSITLSVNSMTMRSAALTRHKQEILSMSERCESSPSAGAKHSRLRSAADLSNDSTKFIGTSDSKPMTPQNPQKSPVAQSQSQQHHRFARSGLAFYGDSQKVITFDKFEMKVSKNIASPLNRFSSSAGGSRQNRKYSHPNGLKFEDSSSSSVSASGLRNTTSAEKPLKGGIANPPILGFATTGMTGMTMASNQSKQSQNNSDQKASSNLLISGPRFSMAGVKAKYGGSNGLNAQVIELWINDTLRESQRERFLQCEADENKLKPKQCLQEFGLDRKTLRHKGLRSEDVDRLYKNFFVYSLGFYEMLFEILKELGDRDSVIVQVWQAYGILLEYCARGEFTTTVNLLELKHAHAIEQLNQIIYEKSNILQEVEGNEQVVVDKFEDIIKDLRSKNSLLTDEKERLDQNNKLLDSQYNQETRMRLQFEYKINELYSIYRELFSKYKRICYETEDQKKRNNRLKNAYEEVQSEKYQLSVKLQESTAENEHLSKDVKVLSQELLQKQHAMSNLQNRMNVMFQNKMHSFEETQRFQTEISNLTFQNSNLKDEYKQRDEQQLWSHEEIQRLVQVVSNQEKDLKAQSTKQLELQSKITALENDVSRHFNTIKLLEERIVEKEKIIAAKDATINEGNVAVSVKSLEIQKLVLQMEEQTIEMENLEECMKKYKQQHSEIEFSLSKANENFQKTTSDFEFTKNNLKNHITEEEELRSKFTNLQAENKRMKDLNTNQIEMLTIRCYKLESDYKHVKDEKFALDKVLGEVRKDKDNYHRQFFACANEVTILRDLIRSNQLDNKELSNALLEKTVLIDQIKRSNDELIANLNEASGKLRITEFALQSTSNQFNEYKNVMSREVQEIRDKFKHEREQSRTILFQSGDNKTIHGMEIEDMLSQITRSTECRIEFEKRIAALNKQVSEMQTTISNLKSAVQAKETSMRVAANEATLRYNKYVSFSEDTIAKKRQELKDSEVMVGRLHELIGELKALNTNLNDSNEELVAQIAALQMQGTSGFNAANHNNDEDGTGSAMMTAHDLDLSSRNEDATNANHHPPSRGNNKSKKKSNQMNQSISMSTTAGEENRTKNLAEKKAKKGAGGAANSSSSGISTPNTALFTPSRPVSSSLKPPSRESRGGGGRTFQQAAMLMSSSKGMQGNTATQQVNASQRIGQTQQQSSQQYNPSATGMGMNKYGEVEATLSEEGQIEDQYDEEDEENTSEEHTKLSSNRAVKLSNVISVQGSSSGHPSIILNRSDGEGNGNRTVSNASPFTQVSVNAFVGERKNRMTESVIYSSSSGSAVVGNLLPDGGASVAGGTIHGSEENLDAESSEGRDQSSNNNIYNNNNNRGGLNNLSQLREEDDDEIPDIFVLEAKGGTGSGNSNVLKQSTTHAKKKKKKVVQAKPLLETEINLPKRPPSNISTISNVQSEVDAASNDTQQEVSSTSNKQKPQTQHETRVVPAALAMAEENHQVVKVVTRKSPSSKRSTLQEEQKKKSEIYPTDKHGSSKQSSQQPKISNAEMARIFNIQVKQQQ